MNILLKIIFCIFFMINSCVAFTFNNYYEDIIEKLSYLPLDTGMPFHKYVLFSIKLEELKQNDILFITSEFEVTNNTNINLMIASSIELCDSTESTTGIIIDPNNGFNISPLMHHGVTTKSRTYKIKEDIRDKFLNVIIWTASSAADSDDWLKIEHNYGHLDLFIQRNHHD